MKKQMRKLTMVLSLLVALAMTVLSYGEHVEAASKVKLNKTKVTLAVGESTTLKMNGTSKKVTWSTSNKKVATVSKGKVTAKKKGTANITAKIGNKKYTCKVTVEAPKLSKTSVTLNQGENTTLKLSGTSRKVTWATSKKSVAKVSNGKVTAVGAGTANITAKVGNKTYTCKVTVEAPKLSKTSVTLNQGKSTTLKLSGTSQKVTWDTDERVAKVSNGKVTAVGAGTANITAKVGSKTYTCKVTVTKSPITGISMKEFEKRLQSFGFQHDVGTTYIYQAPAPSNQKLGQIRVTEDVAYIGLFGGSKKFNAIVKECFNLLLPTQGDTLYNIVSKPVQNQTFYMDGRIVKLKDEGDYVYIAICN